MSIMSRKDRKPYIKCTKRIISCLACLRSILKWNRNLLLLLSLLTPQPIQPIGTHGHCIPGDLIEKAVLEQLSHLLADLQLILAEARRLNEEGCDPAHLLVVRKELNAVEAQQCRLARLYISGVIPEDVVKSQGEKLNIQRMRLEHEREALEARAIPAIDLDQLRRALPKVLAQLRKWVLNASNENMSLLLKALQVQVTASRRQVQLEGIVPSLTPNGKDLVTTERTSA